MLFLLCVTYRQEIVLFINLDELTQFAGRIYRMIKLGLSIGDDDESLGDDGDLTPLEKVEGAADEAFKMEEVV